MGVPKWTKGILQARYQKAEDDLGRPPTMREFGEYLNGVTRQRASQLARYAGLPGSAGAEALKEMRESTQQAAHEAKAFREAQREARRGVLARRWADIVEDVLTHPSKRCEAVREVARKHGAHETQIAETLSWVGLTQARAHRTFDRERAFALLAEGKTQAQIAEILGVSRVTVRKVRLLKTVKDELDRRGVLRAYGRQLGKRCRRPCA